MPGDLNIVGGGLAGLSLGVALRNASVPVTVFEAGHYPRHRVCGEFISGSGQEVLRCLGVLPRLLEAGMLSIATAQFFAGRRCSRVLLLPQPGWSITRHTLDKLLADEFCGLGGVLRTGVRWTQDCSSEGIIRTTGRKPTSLAKGGGWTGLKAHVADVQLRADLELHFFRNGYVGLSRLPLGRVNVCGLFRARAARADDLFRLLRGTEGSVLRDRLNGAEWIEGTRCSISGIRLGLQKTSTDCALGDALALTAPLTGNGMSMALESALLASEALAEYFFRRMSWIETKRRIHDRLRARFRRRLLWGQWLQLAMSQPWLAVAMAPTISHCMLWRTAFWQTR